MLLVCQELRVVDVAVAAVLDAVQLLTVEKTLLVVQSLCLEDLMLSDLVLILLQVELRDHLVFQDLLFAQRNRFY